MLVSAQASASSYAKLQRRTRALKAHRLASALALLTCATACSSDDTENDAAVAIAPTAAAPVDGTGATPTPGEPSVVNPTPMASATPTTPDQMATPTVPSPTPAPTDDATTPAPSGTMMSPAPAPTDTATPGMTAEPAPTVPPVDPPPPALDPADYPDEPFADNPESVTVETGIGWVEGPTWVPDEGGFIYNLSDRCGQGQTNCNIPDEHRLWRPGEDSTEFYWNVSGTNHGAIWSEGLIFMTNREPGRIGYIDPSQDPFEETVLSEGTNLGRPNDLDRFKDGSLYFSDWPNGIGGVHRIRMNGEVEEVISSGNIGSPNGIAFTVECDTLYVTAGGNVQAFDVDDEGDLSNQRRAFDAANLNGIAVDIKGNIYTPSGRDVTVFSPEGNQIGHFDPGQGAVNMTFGGEDRQWLLVTSSSGVVAVRTQIPGGECFGLGTQRPAAQ